MTAQPPNPGARQSFQPPRGTRDFYPIEMARRLWLEDKWRRTAVRHGFDEIDGPTFEHLDLYTVKSGEGIVSELFSFTRAGGETPFALRPEFTPTLARMVADRANALPKPIKWFSIGPYFRAERPQRGRLREFLQWNVDVLGDPTPEADAEAIACCVGVLRDMNLLAQPDEQSGVAPCLVHINHRRIATRILEVTGVPSSNITNAMRLLDSRTDSSEGDEELTRQATSIGLDMKKFYGLSREVFDAVYFKNRMDRRTESTDNVRREFSEEISQLERLSEALDQYGVYTSCTFDPTIVRGLAYYTGAVFEVRITKERAIAGGGRYDNLVELFGGPPTPAVGFAMGDVVISLVLQDKGLMPSDAEIARDLGLAPDAFVIAANDDADRLVLRPVLAALRRAGLHARRSHRATRNIGKLLQEADKAGARYAVILESQDKAQVKNLHSKEQVEVAAPLIETIIAAIPPH